MLFMNVRDYTSVSERRTALEKHLKKKFGNIGSYSLDETVAASKNCENMIGVAQIPLGVAGPLKIVGEFAKGDFFVPIATTEGALVASINRGCKVIAASQGVNVFAQKVGVSRGPVFYTGSLQKSKKVNDWIQANEKLLKKTAESTS